MEYDLTFQDGFFEVVTCGDAEVQKFREFLDETFAHESWRPGMPVMHNHSSLNSAPMTVGDVSQVADFCAESSEKFGHSRLAVVLSRDLEFGLARMWHTFVDGRWDTTAEVFRLRDQAVLWLMQE